VDYGGKVAYKNTSLKNGGIKILMILVAASLLPVLLALSGTLFIILKLLEHNCLTIEHVYSYLNKNGVQLQIAELIDFIHNLNEMGILTVFSI
jgi:hypothetical protein